MRSATVVRRASGRGAAAVWVAILMLVAGCTSAPAPSRLPGPLEPPAESRPSLPAPSPAPLGAHGPVAPVMPVLGARRAISGPRPDLATLLRRYQYGESPVPLDPGAALSDWHLSRADTAAVAGWAGRVSVVAGGTVDLHLRARSPAVRLDVFRVGAHDATHVATIARVAVSWQPDASPASPGGLVETRWPVSYLLPIPPAWRSGFYLVKVTTIRGGLQAYVPFVVTTSQPAPLLVVIPMLTYAAYNGWGGADLYNWWHGPSARAAEVSFDRPFEHGYGAGMLFRLDFPLLVWLEDYGYAPAYATDIDVARNPSLVTGAKVVVLSGHPEYWLGADRDALDAAEARGVSVLAMGANMAYLQVRVLPDRRGIPDRTVVCYKDVRTDPVAALDPAAATTRFQDAPIDRPPRNLLGEDYGGIVAGLSPMVLAPGIATFAANTGLRPGQRLPGLIGDEVDDACRFAGAVMLASTPVRPRGLSPGVAGSSLWITPSGARVFDAGTFDWSWGLDPRWSAALPGFPARDFSQLMADILAWAGADPSSG
jgi:hypothetical protein